MGNDSLLAAPRGRSRLKTAASFIALALVLAAVCATSTTLTKTGHHEFSRLAETRDCGRLCEFGPRPAVTPAPDSNSDSDSDSDSDSARIVEAPVVTVLEVAGGTVGAVGSRPAAIAAPKAPLETLRPAQESKADSTVVSEPITSRPVADRLDFTSAAILTMLADYDGLRPGRQFASLPAGELNQLPPTRQTVALMASRELKALPPQAELAASLDRPAVDSTKAPQVAGWHLVRAIATEELPEEASLAAIVLPALPIRKPDVPTSYLTAAPRSVPQSKISRRVRYRPPTPATSTTSDSSWKSRALFRDN
ncbi:MAG: hypothetical protein KJ587_02110 [Alphaproteobacteria bacterium]|nr:hypothetical protein [Alphaproteobacteria bacterium]